VLRNVVVTKRNLVDPRRQVAGQVWSDRIDFAELSGRRRAEA
jgi:hypothetical protein